MNPTPPLDKEELENEVETVICTLDEKKEKAKKHVTQYQAQRELASKAIRLSCKGAQNAQLQYSKRCFCLTIDMGQNLFFPALNAKQVGDTFYLVPITVLVFGVNGNSRSTGHDEMNVYLWHEKDGRQGSNDIASCLLKDY
eukprot:15323807-Ditylum_brightwellii.AAC.1